MNRSSFRLLQSGVTAFALLLSASAFSQGGSIAETNQGEAAARGGIPGPGDLLWDNTAINNTTNGIVSTALSSLPGGSDRANTADDFVVPTGESWTIDFIYTEGFSNLAVDADSFEIVFYADNGGSPGAVVSTETVPLGGPVTMTTQEMTLSNPVVLTAGTYWVSVIGTYDTGTTLNDGRWNWTTGPTGIGSEWFIQDTAGFFGAPFPWTPGSALGVNAPSTFFALRGTASPAGTPPPATQPVPSLSNLGLILLSLMLAGLALVAIRAR